MAIPDHVRELISIGDRLLTARGSLNSYHQEIAENFYPERAHFTTQISEGDWWEGAMTSEPVLKRREAGNLMQSMLRPEEEFFETHVVDETADNDVTNRRWLEWMTSVQKRAMHHGPAHFTEAMKLADHDWITFGMPVVDIDIRRDMPSLMYRNHHLKDFAWQDNIYGETDTVYRRWKPTARQLVQKFGNRVHSSIKNNVKKDPNARVNCYHIVRPRDGLEDRKRRTPNAPWVSIYVDIDNETVLEETPYYWMRYVIPRWQRLPGSPYGWSPCTGPGLSDARAMQTITRILLDAGEKAVDPPMIGVEEELRSDLNIFAGGVTFYDSNYDYRRGKPLEPLDTAARNLPIGFEMADRHSRILDEGFFLDKLQLPTFGGEQPTAYHVRKMLEEHIRQSAPLIAPGEDVYTATVCERTFEVLRVMKAFGPEENLPQSLRGQTIRYEFKTPIRQLSEELKAQTLLETIELTGAVEQVDQDQRLRVDWSTAYKEALQGNKVPASWLLDDERFQEARERMAEMRAQQQQLETMERGAGIANQAAGAVKQLTDQRAT